MFALKKKTIIKLAIAGILAYEILGACLPFVSVKKVSSSYAEEVKTETFYGQGEEAARAGIVETNLDALNTRLRMFEEAKESIIVSTFDIREGESTTDLFSSLVAAADRGVKVKVIVDGLYGMLHMSGKEIYQMAGSHPNLEIRYYNEPNVLKPWTFNGRMHDKYIIIDHQLLLMGGRNMFNYFIGDYNKNSIGYDREVLYYNGEETDKEANTIWTVKNYFDKVWDLPCCKKVFDKLSPQDENYLAMKADLDSHYQDKVKQDSLQAGNDWNKVTVPVEKATFVTNPTSIGPKEPYVWYTMQQLMLNAKDRVLIQTPYAVFSKDMYEGMEELAAKVGNVNMLINSVAVGDNFMASSDYTQNKQKILDTGVKTYEYFGDHSCHAKSILIDKDLSVVGSYNYDMRSTYVDTETMLVIHGEEFNNLLSEKMDAIQELSLEVNADGTYVEKENVAVKELPLLNKCIFAVSSLVIQLFRYLA